MKARSFAAVVLVLASSACGDDVSKLPDAPTVADAAVDAASVCPPVGAGTDHANALAASASWTAAASPHRIAGQVTVPAGISLALEPCAVVELAAGATLSVAGTLTATGEPQRRVTIRAAGSSPWRWIDVTGTLALRSTTVSGGGAPGSTPELSATIRVRGGGVPAGTTSVTVDDLAIEGSASVGMQMLAGARFAPASTNLRITGAALHPLTVEPIALSEVPAGSYTGNGANVIEVSRVALGGVGQAISVTMQPRGVPYRMGSALDSNPAQTIGVGTGGSATWTILPGTTLRFRPGYRLDVLAAAGGALVAVGNAAAPIVFTSDAATPAAGDWVGITFAGVPTPSTRIDHAVIEFAGNPATSSVGFSCGTPPAGGVANRTMGAINVTSSVVGAAPTAFVTNTAIRDSDSNGIDRGYRADTNVDLAASNTFARIRYCTQTRYRDAANTCPDPVPCPMMP